MSRLIGEWVRSGFDAFELWRNYSNSREQAGGYRQRIVASKAQPFVDGKIIRRAKSEAGDRFGDPGHWHWLALYAELREEYIEGWLPGDYYTFKLIPFLNPRRLAYLSTFKSFDHRIFGPFATEPIAIIINRVCYSPDNKRLNSKQFKEILNGHGGEVVVKRDAAASGKGIEFKQSSNINMADFDPGSSYLIQPLFRQHKALRELYSESINTIRISTYIDGAGNVSVKHKLLRVGHGGSRIVNWGDKDIDLYLDHSGQVTEASQDGIGRKIENQHPDNGYPLLDIVVPSMSNAVEACLEAHHSLPYIRYIAWDVYIDERGEPRMIEWNAVNPSIWVHEARIGPLWSEEEIKEALVG
jgi:hypothetical protein